MTKIFAYRGSKNRYGQSESELKGRCLKAKKMGIGENVKGILLFLHVVASATVTSVGIFHEASVTTSEWSFTHVSALWEK